MHFTVAAINSEQHDLDVTPTDSFDRERIVLVMADVDNSTADIMQTRRRGILETYREGVPVVVWPRQRGHASKSRILPTGA